MTPTLAALALATLWCLAWAPFFWCCCSTDCTTTVNVRVRGCDNPGAVYLSGATASVKIGGTTVASGTTLGGGSYVSIAVVAPTGTAATIEITGMPTGYATTSTAITLACTTINSSITATVASGYSCTKDFCCPQSGSPPYANVTLPTTLYLDDSFGTITLTKSGSFWYGCATRTATFAYTSCASPFPSGTNLDVDIEYRLECSGGGNWTLAMFANTCGTSLLTGYTCGGTPGPYTTGSGSLSGSCFSLTGTTPTTAGFGSGPADRDVYDAAGGGTTITVSD
jgi:hypothetical protein